MFFFSFTFSNRNQQNHSRNNSNVQKYLSQKSQKILQQKFANEFEDIVTDLVNDIEVDEVGRKWFDLAVLFEILIKTGFIKYSPEINNS